MAHNVMRLFYAMRKALFILLRFDITKFKNSMIGYGRVILHNKIRTDL